MSGAINQMQMAYAAEEDRILFRVNSTEKQEFRFWITRRYALLMLAVLSKHSDSDPDVTTQENPEAKRAVQSFKQEKAINEANFEKKFEDAANEQPLGEDAQLAFKLNYNIQNENLHLGIQPKTGKGINMVISREINSSLTQLLLSAAKKGDWRLKSTLSVSPPNAETRVVN